MKKLIFILVAAAAMSCGDGSNRSSERDDDELENDADKTEQAAPDTATNGGVQSDTTSMYDRDRDSEINNPDNSGRKSSTEKNGRDSRSSRTSRKDSAR